MYLLNYVAVALIGALVGGTELVGRYRDKPYGPLKTAPGWLYIAVNVLASLFALWFIRNNTGLTAPGEGLADPVWQVLVAGLAAMAFFRSSIFTLRLGETDVPLGPAAVLQIILTAADRSYDRDRGVERSTAVGRIMDGVSFERAAEALPVYCSQLMQNMSRAELEEAAALIKNLGESQSIGPRVKSYALGLILMNLVGEDLLERAVKDLSGRIRGPNEEDTDLLTKALGFRSEDADRLLQYCAYLVPEISPTLSETLEAELKKAIDTIKASAESEGAKALTILRKVQNVYGSRTVELALDRLAGSLAGDTSPPPGGRDRSGGVGGPSGGGGGDGGSGAPLVEPQLAVPTAAPPDRPPAGIGIGTPGPSTDPLPDPVTSRE